MTENNMGNDGVEVTKELLDIGKALDAYAKANEGLVVIAASVIAFDRKKLDEDADDVIVPGSDRIFVAGDIESLRISLNELRDVVEDSVDTDGWVNI